jgi:hypothetical protein
MDWDFIPKNNENWTDINKSDITIYLVSENGDFYLVGQNQDEYLITQEQGSNWDFIDKN